MAVDVKAEVVINRSKDEVAGYAKSPDNAPVWISGIADARMLTEPPVGQGHSGGEDRLLHGRVDRVCAGGGVA